MATTITATTDLEAVNSMLQAIGADPVNSLASTDDSDVINAKALLSEVSREVQSQGWDFNVDTEYVIARTVDNEYVVPPNCIDIDISDSLPGIRGVFRGGKLWNQEKHTFSWDVALKFDVTWLFPFNELPQSAKHYIAMKSARKFQARTVGASSLEKYTEQDEQDAYSIFKDAEALSADYSMLTGPVAFRILYRRA